MPSTSAVHLLMRKRRAAELVEGRIDGVSVENPDPDGEVVVRLEGDGTYVATIADEEDLPSGSSGVHLEYVTEGPPRAERKAGRIRRLLSYRVR